MLWKYYSIVDHANFIIFTNFPSFTSNFPFCNLLTPSFEAHPQFQIYRVNPLLKSLSCEYQVLSLKLSAIKSLFL